MSVSIETIKASLAEKGLKITPQRIYILEAVYALNNHPTAEMILNYINRHYPGIATGTLYKVLDTLAEKNLIRRVKTDRDAMRYDGMTENHHHLYSSETGKISDYFDKELDEFLEDYFRKKKIENFRLENIQLQINGSFLKDRK